MAWTTPGTATAGEVLTAAFWNVNVRDNSNASRQAAVNVKQTAKTDTSEISLAANTLSGDVSGLTLSFTPSATTSKVLVTASLMHGSAQPTIIGFVLYRDGSAIGVGTSTSNRAAVTAAQNVSNDQAHYNTFSFLDSPATTSAVTYSVRVRHTFGSTNSIYINRRQTDTDSLNLFRGISVITAQEVPV